jgi:hypothetical protein
MIIEKVIFKIYLEINSLDISINQAEKRKI